MNKPTNPQVGKKYRVIKVEDDEEDYISVGDIVELQEEDDTDCPEFTTVKGKELFLYWDQLEPLEKTFETLEVGDVVLDQNKYECKVLEKTTHLVALAEYDDEYCLEGWYTKHEFEQCYTIKQEPPEIEFKALTLDKIAEKFHIPVNQIRIKKEEK